jgi:glucan phosphoethanolaminetransferase (alkaline phosphatase superfamily)
MERRQTVTTWWAALQAGAIAAIIAQTNIELPSRAMLLVEQSRYGTLLTTFAVWAVAALAIIIVVTEPRNPLRLFWGIVLALGGAIAWGFQQAASLELSVFDLLGFWEARHETGNAMAIYGQAMLTGTLLFICSAALFAMPHLARSFPSRRFGFMRAVFPALPVAVVAGIVFMKGGNGHFGMPKQFSQFSLGALAAAKIAMKPDVARQPVVLKAGEPKVADHILVLVDESVRPDFVSALRGNKVTPHFAEFASGLVDYGPAASGGICSNYANAILRFMASRKDIGGNIASNPTVWAYAKAAGYRTVYIDAQAHAITNTTRMQNFMTNTERGEIDAFYPLAEAISSQADFKLLDIIADELAKPGPVFIFANKQGVHFPYDANYLPKDAIYKPTQTEAGTRNRPAMINSYRNALHNNVENFAKEFNKRVIKKNLAMVYTSDHGQYFAPGESTHCRSSDAEAEMALVPLYAFASQKQAMVDLRIGAELSKGRANHFQIAPTVLNWMGYAAADIAKLHSESLTTGTTQEPAFTLGDIFGLFSSDVTWSPIDLQKDYAEKPVEQLAGAAAESANP